MAILAPFRGLIYNPEKITDLSRVITPPYDVISPQQQESLYARHPHNMIQLDLGKNLPGDSPTCNRYTRAARFLKNWQKEKVLVREPKPAIYLYRIHYPFPGQGLRQRTGFIALLGLEPFDSGMVRPHEKTFSGIKVDRFHLLDHCQAQFCPIFSFYSDPENQVVELLSSRAHPQPFIDYQDDDGLRHQLWRVTDKAVLKKVQKGFQDKFVYIADGHHRYETGLAYKQAMQDRYPDSPAGSPFNFTLMFLCNMFDPGLAILPTHRVLCDFPEERLAHFEQDMVQDFEVERFPYQTANKKKVKQAFLTQMKQKARQGHVLGVFSAAPSTLYLLSLKGACLEGACAEDLHPILRKLDVMILSRLVLQKVLGIKPEELDRENLIEYRHDTREAMALVETGRCRMAFLLNPPPIGRIQEVADAGLVMPRKSTFFYPKIPTGLVINIMKPNEIIMA